MRKNKKLLLGGLSVLTLVAAGSGAVSTFAWFTATGAASISNVTNNTNDSFRVQNNAEVTGYNMRVRVVWPGSFTAVDLTAGVHVNADGENVEQEIGNAYVYDANNKVKANTDANVRKIATASITLSTTASHFETKIANTGVDASDWRTATTAEIDALDGKSLTVTITGSNQLRVYTGADNGLSNNAVGAASSYTGVAQSLGTATAHVDNNHAVTWTYVATYDINGSGAGNEDTSLNFRYSVSPKENVYPAENHVAESTSQSYGTFTVAMAE